MAGPGRDLVIDASVLIKCFLAEPLSDRAIKLLKADATLSAPDFIYAECANALWKRVRGGLMSKQEATATLADHRHRRGSAGRHRARLRHPHRPHRLRLHVPGDGGRERHPPGHRRRTLRERPLRAPTAAEARGLARRHLSPSPRLPSPSPRIA